MATHSSILAWRIPWTEEPGGLQSVRSQRVGHDWSDLACTHAYPQLHETMQLGSCCSFLRNICSQILAGLQSSWGLTWVEVQDGAHTRLFGVVVGRSHQWGNGLHFSQHGGSAPRCSIGRASIPKNPGGSCQESSAYSDAAASLPLQGQPHSSCERPTQGHEYYGSWGAHLGDGLYHN